MQTALRKMGNSTGMIVPRTLLAEIGVSLGAAMDIRIEDGRLVATPIAAARRDGWAPAAQALADDEPLDEWHGFANEGDAELNW